MEEFRFSKKLVANIEKCYAVCPIIIRGIDGFLIATEKAGGCFFFNLAGDQLETVWDEPGGIMSLVPVPGGAGQFLSTQEFYSPNDSAKARIVVASPLAEGWEVKTLAQLPFVHRFDILSTPEQDYLIACTLKSGHEYKEDWTNPGKVYVCPLPEDLNAPDCELKFEVLMEGLTKNHGYYRGMEDGRPCALVSSENGIFKVMPPSPAGLAWRVEQLLDQPSSDATMVDLDGDGNLEMIRYAPFHGDDLSIYRLKDGAYTLDYAWPEKVEFLHAIWSGTIQGQPCAIVGHRKGKRDLFIIRYDPNQKTYTSQVIDQDCGSANVAVIKRDELLAIIATNRETNEVAMYTLEA